MAILKTIDELTEYVEASSLTSFDSIKPSVRTAERRFLVPVLGDGQYQELLDAYNEEPQDLSPDEEQLLALSQEAIANIAMALAVPRLSLQLGDSGARRSESDTMKTAFQYQEVNAREAYSQAGFDALEDVLAFLEAKKLVFTTWAASPAFSDYKAYFIQSGIDFNCFYANKQSRLMYINVRYIMKRIENFDVRDILGKKLFDTLKTAQKAGTLSTKYKALLEDYICPGIALLTVAKALYQRAVDITENGVTVSLLGVTKNSQERQPAPDAKIAAMVADLTADGSEYLRRLGEELKANPGDYPDYEAPTERPSLLDIDNQQCNGYYAV